MASVFDPLGVLSPILVCVKNLFQEACVSKLGWDEVLGKFQQKQWHTWLQDLKETEKIEIPRCLYENKDQVIEYELHGFSDASNKAYCAMVYLVYKTQDGWHVSLITSKTRVAPLKELTVPRLELMGARVLAQLMANVKSALQPQLEITKCHYWVDSMTTLYWIQNRGEWKQFVRHRVDEILKLSAKENWHHCPGEENPADIGSRGVMPSALKRSELWWKGPQFLVLGKEFWPRSLTIEETPEGASETKVTVSTTSVTEVSPTIENVVNVRHFSSCDRLFRVTAWMLRFINNVKCKITGEALLTGDLQVKEVESAEVKWIRAAQQTVINSDSYRELSTNLGLFEDGELIRCKGRIGLSDLEYDTKFPILLPRNHYFTELVVNQCHQLVCHNGVRSTLTELRGKYWVPKGRQFVKKVIGKCFVCKRVEGRPYNPPAPPPLPDFRVRPAPVFDKCGLDFCGPLFTVEKGGSMAKVYIALFTCCTSRAVYLDLVSDLSVPTFLRCLRKFIAKFGLPSLIVSDNASTFKASARFLNELQKDARFSSFCVDHRLQWKFNLERAPMWGGFFERIVGLVKRCLKKVLGTAKLTFDELLTVLLEIESSLNARPLTYIDTEPEGEILTPFHLIYGRRINSLPSLTEGAQCETSLGKRYQYLCLKKEHFWNRWSKEYLVSLREFHNLQTGARKKVVAVGDVVLVHGEGTRRSEWKVGVVQQLIKGKDQEVRGASVRIISRNRPLVINRPVQKLYPLEVNVDQQLSESLEVNVDQQLSESLDVSKDR